MLNVGIIGGAGKMGSWLAAQLKEKHHIIIYDINVDQMYKVAMQLNIDYEKKLEALVKKSNMIIVAVTLSKVSDVLLELLSFTLDNKIIFDIASFKRNIIPIYLKYPRTVFVCSVHPLFGPGAKTIKNAPIVIIPIPGRENDANSVKQFFEMLNTNMMMIDWETHDNIMGIVLGIPYITGLSIAMTIKDNEELIKKLSGTSFKFFSLYINAMLSEDANLISEIVTNESSKKAIENYINIMKEISKLRDNELQNLILSLKNQLSINYDSYKKIYNIIYSQDLL
ncbi:MAG: prephenate dehydrogenase/arogenate dehydrogenase family protein [Thermoprotei archaeon]